MKRAIEEVNEHKNSNHEELERYKRRTFTEEGALTCLSVGRYTASSAYRLFGPLRGGRVRRVYHSWKPSIVFRRRLRMQREHAARDGVKFTIQTLRQASCNRTLRVNKRSNLSSLRTGVGREVSHHNSRKKAPVGVFSVGNVRDPACGTRSRSCLLWHASRRTNVAEFAWTKPGFNCLRVRP